MKEPFEYTLRTVRVFTTDLGRALDFYTKSLGMNPDTINEAEGYALFPIGEATLLLEAMDPADRETADLVGRFVGASLAVDDIQEVYKLLSSKGVHFSHPPQRQAWGGVMTHFHDPDNNVLTLIQ